MNRPAELDLHIVLRAPEPYDIETMFRWENDLELWSFGTQIAPYSVENLREYVLNYNPDIFLTKQLRLMIVDKVSAETVGMIDLYDFDPTNRRAAVGIMIASGFRKKGYALEAISLLEKVYCERIGLHQLWAVVAKDNVAARALFDKAGFAISGCLRSWIRRKERYDDAYVYQHLLV
ncbi:MAG: GNAT family N-acetyltransferase [Paramuribaculum sp.]|nr:GNAT family N-acetyltransferase [Paramuribaculum sp.]